MSSLETMVVSFSENVDAVQEYWMNAVKQSVLFCFIRYQIQTDLCATLLEDITPF